MQGLALARKIGCQTLPWPCESLVRPRLGTQTRLPDLALTGTIDCQTLRWPLESASHHQGRGSVVLTAGAHQSTNTKKRKQWRWPSKYADPTSLWLVRNCACVRMSAAYRHELEKEMAPLIHRHLSTTTRTRAMVLARARHQGEREVERGPASSCAWSLFQWAGDDHG